MKLLKYFTISIIFIIILFSDDIPNYFQSPKALKDGLIATDNLQSQLYLVKNNELKPILSARGCGAFFTVSPNQAKIGIKLIEDNGLEAPAIFNVTTNELTKLTESVQNAGQVSFSDNGLFAYTIGNELHISDGRKFDLGNYANLAPISPNGKYVAYNNDDDQIFILNLDNQRIKQITNSEFSYYNPQWSPDGKKLMISRFDGKICIYFDETLSILDEGHSPVWQDDETILYYKKEIEEMRLLNTDVYSIKFDGSNALQLTNTKDKFETDPVFDKINDRIIYTDQRNNSLEYISAGQSLSKKSQPQNIFTKDITIAPAYYSLPEKTTQPILDVPYIHQVYDVPDWYWGYYACAPTTAAMVLAYFNILPEWETTCSSPSRHVSKYGRYICEKYRYNEWYYQDGSKPNGNAAGYGGYGYMWGTGGSPNSRMLNYYEKHGITGSQSWNSQGKWSEAVSEIENENPYSMCVWLTGSGHVVLGKGIVEGKHSIIVNDPYGNRNTPGYPSYDGAGATYDWPGYNHGNINLALNGSGLPWVVVSHYNRPAISDTLIDDKQFGHGFNLNTDEPATMLGYADKKSGYNEHFWYMLTQSMETTHYAEWAPVLEEDGNYELFVYIPEFEGKSQNAIYQIYTGDEWEIYPINQNFADNDWASLGIYSLEKGNDVKIRLTDSTNTDGEYLVIDALKWKFVGNWTMDFTVENPSGSAPHTADFSELIQYESPNCDYYWDFGDGVISYDQNPIHVYKTPGNFDVALTLYIGSKEYHIIKEDYITVSEVESGDFSLISPKIDTVLAEHSPTFSWNAIDNSQYLFYINKTSDFSATEPQLLDSNVYIFADSLEDNFEYFWMVKAITDQDTMTSNIGYFQLNLSNDPPDNFSLLFPKPETILKSEFCTFQWQKSSDNDVYDEINYSVNLWHANDSSQMYWGNKNFCSDTLEDNTTYYWNVIAVDKHNGRTATEHSRFHVNKYNDDPSIVELLTPENGATSYGKYPQFSWTPSVDIDPLDSVSYEVYIFKVGNEKSGVIRAVDTCYYDEQKISSDSEYGFTVTAYDQNGGWSQSDTNFFYLSTTAIDEELGVPSSFSLHQNYPNPFNPSTSIKFDLPQASLTKLTIYDIQGNLVETLVNTQLEAGYHTYTWQPENISSGVYFIRVEVMNNNYQQVDMKKCLLIK